MMNEAIDMFRDIKEISDSKYLFSKNPENDADAYEDLIMNCHFCGKKIELLGREVKTVKGCATISGTIVNAQHITFDDGSESYICDECFKKGAYVGRFNCSY